MRVAGGRFGDELELGSAAVLEAPGERGLVYGACDDGDSTILDRDGCLCCRYGCVLACRAVSPPAGRCSIRRLIQTCLLDVYFTRHADDTVIIGPDVVPASGWETYNNSDMNLAISLRLSPTGGSGTSWRHAKSSQLQ